MTLEEIHTQLRKLAESAEIEKIYVELGHPEVPTDLNVLIYGSERMTVGLERGREYAYKHAARLIKNYIEEHRQ
jgi:hypothetical protein